MRCCGYPIWSGVFLPYGQEFSPQITMNSYKFTGDEHDSESNLEHTMYRQYEAVQGRWLSADPSLGSMDVTNPQSLNRYAYVGNAPSLWVDPFGLNECAPGDYSASCRSNGGGLGNGASGPSGGAGYAGGRGPPSPRA